ncbi:MAG TPA: (d)CMP kinase [Bacteroidia bacterium]|jgi:cytidylate kinase|nr:(d)CMP kinase [Bacteroidia bacterium]
MRNITIAIDGYSSCGKSTVSRDLANALGYAYIDTGAMYRAVTLYCLEKKLIQEDRAVDALKVIKELLNIHIEFKYSPEAGKSETYLNGRNVENEIRGMEVSNLVSRVSAIHEVRKMMVYLQRNMGKNGEIVMDGRDIGTTVFPKAELKIFMTADLDVRVQRRKLDLEAKGIKAKDSDVRKNIERRDEEDSTRLESPLTQAPDAILLDNTKLTREEQLEKVLRWAKEKMVG